MLLRYVIHNLHMTYESVNYELSAIEAYYGG